MAVGQPDTRDYFAEMYVAGILADNGWNVYFPRRDQGFDFIITKPIENQIRLRPVQVKGKYPQKDKRDAAFYGYLGSLSQLHPDMVLAIAFFPTDRAGVAPDHVAYMPYSRVRPQRSWGYQCQPACYRSGKAESRRDFRKYFDRDGMLYMESATWG